MAAIDESEVFRVGLTTVLNSAGIRATAVAPRDALAWGSASRSGSGAIVSVTIPGSRDLVESLVGHGLSVVALIPKTPGAAECSNWIQLGARTALGRDASATVLVAALSMALEGWTLVAHEIAMGLCSEPRAAHCRCLALDAQDRLVLRSLASGATIQQLASSINRSERDCYRVLSKLWQRLGVSDRTGAIVHAARCGLLDTDDRS